MSVLSSSRLDSTEVTSISLTSTLPGGNVIVSNYKEVPLQSSPKRWRLCWHSGSYCSRKWCLSVQCSCSTCIRWPRIRRLFEKTSPRFNHCLVEQLQVLCQLSILRDGWSWSQCLSTYPVWKKLNFRWIVTLCRHHLHHRDWEWNLWIKFQWPNQKGQSHYVLSRLWTESAQTMPGERILSSLQLAICFVWFRNFLFDNTRK